MWILLGAIAIGATLVNLFMYHSKKEYKLAMAIALSFTALTLCAEYQMVSVWTRGQDWAAIEDVVPTMGSALWTLTLVSILLNMAPIFLEKFRRK